MDYNEKSKYIEPNGSTYMNPKTGETLILMANQEVPEGYVKKGGRKRKSMLNTRKIRQKRLRRTLHRKRLL